MRVVFARRDATIVVVTRTVLQLAHGNFVDISIVARTIVATIVPFSTDRVFGTIKESILAVETSVGGSSAAKE